MFFGYHKVRYLPIKVGQRVEIPAGTWIRSDFPVPVNKRSLRRQTVTVSNLGSGHSISHWRINSENRNNHPEFTEWFDVYPALHSAFHNLPDLCPLTIRRVSAFMNKFSVPVENPRIVWAGEKGYWKSCDINELLYGRRPPYPPPVSDVIDDFWELMI